DAGDHGEDHGWKGFAGPRVVVLPETPAEARTEEADQITGYGAKPFISMRLPVAFLLDHLGPRLYEGLDGPASIRQRRTRAAHGLCRETSVGQRGEDGPPTEQKPTRNQGPEQPEQPHIRPNRHLGQEHAQQNRNTVDYGRHRASLQE